MKTSSKRRDLPEQGLIVIAPDSFKGSLSAQEAAEAMARGVKQALPLWETVLLPLSDGGEGLVAALTAGGKGDVKKYLVQDPLGRPVWAEIGFLDQGKTAVIEMAQASGLTLLKGEERNPLVTSTFGTGELILHALTEGCERLIMGLGGSATNDGGVGMAKALGYRFLDKFGRELEPGGGELIKLATIDGSMVDPRLQKVKIEAACDVKNPLLGPKGASFVYGPQKGAGPDTVVRLDQGLKNLAEIVARDLKQEVADVPGSGAAGGLGAGLLAFAQGRLVSGIELVLDVLDFETRIKKADLILTGEGKLDGQSAYGKVPLGVARAGRKAGVPVVAIAGTVLPDAANLRQEGLSAYFSILNQPMTVEEAMEKAARLLENQAAEVARLYSL